MSKIDLMKRLQKTEQKGVFKDPETGALIIKTPQREKIIDEAVNDKIPMIEKKLEDLDKKLDKIFAYMTK